MPTPEMETARAMIRVVSRPPDPFVSSEVGVITGPTVEPFSMSEKGKQQELQNICV